MHNKKRGCFITLEGIEGVGKSTHLEFIRQLLQASGVANVVLTREPGGTPLAESIRHILLSHHDETLLPETELLLLFAGRAQHIHHLIEPSLARGEWVICDRFVDASFAYQGAGRGIPDDFIRLLEQWIVKAVMPDLTFLFDAPVTQALSRIRNRDRLDRFEAEAEQFFQRVRECYLARARLYSGRFKVIDASVSPEAVQEQIDAALKTFIKIKK